VGTLIQYIHFFLPCQLQCCLSSLCKSTFKQEKFLAVVLCPMNSCKNYNVNYEYLNFTILVSVSHQVPQIVKLHTYIV
jgi:hypothetical protein